MHHNLFEYQTQAGKKNHLDIQNPRAGRMAMLPVFKPDTSSPLPSAQAKKSLDGIHTAKKTFVRHLVSQPFTISTKRLFRKWQIVSRRAKRLFFAIIPVFAPRKLMYGSLSGGVALGMVGMGFVGQITGPEVSAQYEASNQSAMETTAPASASAVEDIILPPYNSENDIFFEYFNSVSSDAYEQNIRRMVAGYPIEEMLPYIFEKDHLVAAFLIGIAKKESNWGKRVPVLEGQDCFNYWGYRGIRKMMGTGGHTCFNSQKDAVDSVGKRLETLIHSQNMDTPEKLIIWKCGYSCEGHSRESVKKWIADVDRYFSEANYEE